VKSLLEMVGGVALLYPAAFFMDRYGQGAGSLWLWLTLGILGAVFLGMALATVLTVKEEPLTTAAPTPLKEALKKSFRIDLRAERRFVWFLVSRLLIITTFTTLQTFALYYVKDVFGITNPAQVSAQFLILAALVIPLSLFFAGRLSDRFGRRPIAVMSAVLGVGGLTFVIFARDITQLLICGGILGIAFGSFMSTNWALATQMAAPGEGGRYMGLTNMATAGGSALARLVGPMIDFFNGKSANSGYTAMLIFCLVCFTVGVAILVMVEGKPRGEAHSP
jgi:MFS-type transporter involved in bile tolerance (Atg22 family)